MVAYLHSHHGRPYKYFDTLRVGSLESKEGNSKQQVILQYNSQRDNQRIRLNFKNIQRICYHSRVNFLFVLLIPNINIILIKDLFSYSINIEN